MMLSVLRLSGSLALQLTYPSVFFYNLFVFQYIFLHFNVSSFQYTAVFLSIFLLSISKRPHMKNLLLMTFKPPPLKQHDIQ